MDDLASTRTDAVVRPATCHLEPIAEPTRLDQLAASPLWHSLPPDRPLDLGAAVVTDGGSLAADYVVHAVISSPTKPLDGAGIARVTRSVLERAQDWEFSKIAMPVLGGSASQLGLEAAARTLIATVLEERTATYPSEVCIVVESEEDKVVVDAVLKNSTSREP